MWIQSWDRTYRFAGSLAPYIIQPFRHPPKKGVQSPKAFICVTSHWINEVNNSITLLTNEVFIFWLRINRDDCDKNEV